MDWVLPYVFTRKPWALVVVVRGWMRREGAERFKRRQVEEKILRRVRYVPSNQKT